MQKRLKTGVKTSYKASKVEKSSLFELKFFKVFLWLLLIVVVVFLFKTNNARQGFQVSEQATSLESLNQMQNPEFKPFNNNEEFQEFLAQNEQVASYKASVQGFTGRFEAGVESVGAPLLEVAAGSRQGVSEPSVERFSTTNVQVSGIDEPDILKIGGGKAFFANTGLVNVIKAFPVEDLSIASTIGASTMLPGFGKTELFYKPETETIIVLNNKQVQGFDVSNIEKPSQKWVLKLNNSQLISARLINNDLYLITKQTPTRCPFTVGTAIIPCHKIYRPSFQSSFNGFYTVLKLNPNTGIVKDSVSFPAQSSYSYYRRTDIYMSENNLYVAYNVKRYENEVLYFLTLKYGYEVFPESFVSKVLKLDTYDISLQAKIFEFSLQLQNYLMTLPLEQQEEFQNKLRQFFENHEEEALKLSDSTVIVKIDNKDLAIKATTNVQGHLLNQFSMDEFENYFRIATTTQAFLTTSTQRYNNLFILDEKLSKVGELTKFEPEERIYSVRFMGEKAYVVTYKQVDPLLVIDVSNPASPKIAGKLEIPGYSSYLHPLTKNLLLGVGKDGRYVKIALFNVENPYNPLLEDSFYLQAYWSDVLNTHHAFLWDDKHNIVAIPANNYYYLFNIDLNNKKINLKKMVDLGWTPLRSGYINDYLYVFSDRELAVVNENSFEIVKRIQLKSGYIFVPNPRRVLVGQ
ncbi:beta-propeller domain-containing protein [Candidatus Woesearchaeota archaeon]|nr:beta-propeller domain-containing protein [Candidatus Woesearchaeota archaeon]